MIRMLYWFYELQLRRDIERRPLPHHVGIILDGNRRFAHERGYEDPGRVYQLGADKLDDVLSWCIELGIPTVTLWVLSIDNMRRSQDEVAAILAAVEQKIASLSDAPATHQRGIAIRAVGRLDLLPPETVRILREAGQRTAANDALTVIIAIAYGGREEIVDAVRSYIRAELGRGADVDKALEAMNPANLDRHLYTAGLPDPDLIIRTSGEFRLSGFLLWQSARSEFYFSDVNWPEFRKIDFLRAIRAYQGRQRRFGQ